MQCLEGSRTCHLTIRWSGRESSWPRRPRNELRARRRGVGAVPGRSTQALVGQQEFYMQQRAGIPTQVPPQLLACLGTVMTGLLLTLSGGSVVPQWTGATVSLGGLLASFVIMRRMGWLRSWVIVAFGVALVLAAGVGQWLTAAT